ncbi:MAG: conserved rane protein of unknown function, MviN-like [Candidatus Angelobacter sp.]|jgi:putative peptidoglycan lipid II flippase|nr:conserved rane protein of unknown function, MviN-like [Candidatus Angelobacter sp.]
MDEHCLEEPASGSTLSDQSFSNSFRAYVNGGIGLRLQLSSLTALQILFSFGIQAYAVIRLGAGVQTDALAAGYTVPQVAMLVTTEVLGFVLVPVLAGKPERDLRQNGWELFIGLGFFSTLIALALYLAIPMLIPVLVPGLGTYGKHLAMTLARIQVFSFIGATLYAVLTSLYQVRCRFIRPAATFFFAHVVSMGILLWKLPQLGVSLVAWIQLVIAFVPAILLLPILGTVRNITFDFSVVRQVLRNMRPLSLGAAYFKTSVLPDRLLGSFLAPGSIIILDLAGRTCGAIERVLNQGIVTPIVPRLVTLAKSGEWSSFQRLYQKKLVEIFCINAAILAFVVLIYFGLSSNRGMNLVGRMPGSLGHSGIKAILAVFLYMSGRLLLSGLNHTLANAFYATGDWTTPTKINAYTYTVGLLAKVVGFLISGLQGIALATSFWALINFIALYFCITARFVRQNPDAMRSRAVVAD